jgi:hypothetical protein
MGGVRRELKEYLHSPKFRDQLVRQYKNFEILCEAALRTAVANLLRTKIRALGGPARGYRVVCEPRLGVNVVPDLLIWKNKSPRVWIELKDTGRFDKKKAQADWEKLQTYFKKCSSLKSGYLIYVARSDGGDIGIKRNNNTRRYWPITIALEHHIPKFDRWEAEYQRRAHYKFPKQKAKKQKAKECIPASPTCRPPMENQ